MRSEEGAGKTTIAAINFHSRETSGALVDGFTIDGNGEWRAVSISNKSHPTLTHNIFTRGSADRGGAIYCGDSSNPIIIDNHFSDNEATVAGGAIYGENANLVLRGNVIVRNHARNFGYGGGIYLNQCEAKLENNTIVHNTVQFSPDSSLFSYGGGICSDSSRLNVSQCVIAFNTGGGLHSMFVPMESDTISHTDIHGNTCFVGDWESFMERRNHNGNLCKDPLFCNPDSGDYHLSSTSPCAPANNSGTLIGALPVGCSPTDVDETEENLPIAFALRQNYPNPFNPTTTIEYSVPRHSQVTLEIFNILGQSIRTLVNECSSSGEIQCGMERHIERRERSQLRRLPVPHPGGGFCRDKEDDIAEMTLAREHR